MGLLFNSSSNRGRGCCGGHGRGCGRNQVRRCRICGREWGRDGPACNCQRRGCFCNRRR